MVPLVLANLCFPSRAHLANLAGQILGVPSWPLYEGQVGAKSYLPLRARSLSLHNELLGYRAGTTNSRSRTPLRPVVKNSATTLGFTTYRGRTAANGIRAKS